jgi:hypothetical protein
MCRFFFPHGMRLSQLGTAAAVPAPDGRWCLWSNRRNANWQGIPKYLRKPTQVPLCRPQIPHDQNRARTRAAALGSRRHIPEDGILHSHRRENLKTYIVFLFGEATQRHSLQPPAHAGSSLADFSSLKMEAIRSSETSVHTRSTPRHIPADGILRVIMSAIKVKWHRLDCPAQV